MRTLCDCHGDELQNNSGIAFDLRRLKPDEHARFVIRSCGEERHAVMGGRAHHGQIENLCLCPGLCEPVSKFSAGNRGLAQPVEVDHFFAVSSDSRAKCAALDRASDVELPLCRLQQQDRLGGFPARSIALTKTRICSVRRLVSDARRAEGQVGMIASATVASSNLPGGQFGQAPHPGLPEPAAPAHGFAPPVSAERARISVWIRLEPARWRPRNSPALAGSTRELQRTISEACSNRRACAGAELPDGTQTVSARPPSPAT